MRNGCGTDAERMRNGTDAERIWGEMRNGTNMRLKLNLNPISVPFRILTPSVLFRILTPSVTFRFLTPSVPFRFRILT